MKPAAIPKWLLEQEKITAREMKPRNLDRFERMVRKEQQRDDWGIAVVLVEDVLKLLRKEHAWMRRMVREVGKEYATSDRDSSAENLMWDILNRLDQRRK